MSGASDRRQLFDLAAELAFCVGGDEGLVSVFPPAELDEAWHRKDDVEFARWTIERLAAILFAVRLIGFSGDGDNNYEKAA